MKNSNTPSEPPERDEITRDELLRTLKGRGHDVTTTQVERWHKLGLLPRPRQVPLGRGLGSETRYPKAARDEALAIVEERRRTRKLIAVGWNIWLTGRTDRVSAARPFLISVTRAHDRVVRTLRVLGFGRADVSNRAMRLVSSIASQRARGPVFGAIHSRVGDPNRVETVLRVILQVATGRFDETYRPTPAGPTDDEGRIVETALGLEGARTDSLMGVGPWLKGDAHEGLQDLARFLAGSWVTTLERATDAELVEARDAYLEFRELFVSFGDVIREHFGPKAFGFPVLANLLRDPVPLHSAFMVVWTLRIQRDPQLSANLDELLRAGKDWRQIVPQLEALRVLRREVPALHELLAPQRIGTAMRDTVTLSAFQLELRCTAELHRTAVMAALARHPELGELQTVEAIRHSGTNVARGDSPK